MLRAARVPNRTLKASAVVGLLLIGGGAVAAGADTAGSRAHTEVIGRSVEDRPITVRRVGDSAGPTKVLVVGELHGNEAAGLPVISALRERGAPDGVELILLKRLNPDGLEHGTRQNARGVDLNRNFPRRWRERGSPGSTYYSGPRPLSEPESRAAVRLIKRIDPDVTIWYHQALRMVDESKGADRSLVRRYAEIVNLPSYRLTGFHGNATQWQNHRYPGTSSFVVELAAGRLSPRQVRRHVRAVRTVGREARGER